MIKFLENINSVSKLFKQNETYISEGMKFLGDIEADKDLVIDGEMYGNIKSSKHVILGPTSHFEGNIECETALLSGFVKGRVVTRRSLDVRLPATIIGDLVSAAVRIDSGAVIQGNIFSKPAEPKSLPMTAGASAYQAAAEEAVEMADTTPEIEKK